MEKTTNKRPKSEKSWEITVAEVSHSRTSAEKIVENGDLLREIFLHLPAKLCIRSELVSKHWRSLITNPSFSHRHMSFYNHRPKPQPYFILSTDPTQFFYLDPIGKAFGSIQFNSPYTRILQSCHGLLLLESRVSKCGPKVFSVFNPVTNQSKTLCINPGDRSISGFCLVMDPSRSPYYKIVLVMATKVPYPEYVVEMYNSETDEWTCMGIPFPPFTNNKFRNGIYWNNKVYWIRPTTNSLYFDLDTRNVGSVPDHEKTPGRKNYIIESNGHIHCVAIPLRPERKSLLVFELLEDNSGWFELYKVNLNPISAVVPEMSSEVRVLGIVRGETEHESSILLHVLGKAIYFKFYDGSFQVVLDLTRSEVYEDGELQFSHNNTYQLIDSLALV